MTLILLISKWREILIGLLAFLLLICLFLLNNKTGQIEKFETQCNERIAKAIKPYQEAQKKQQDKLNEVSADHEQLKSEQRVKTETITRELQTIIERPVYQSICIDDDGLSKINSLIQSNGAS